MFDFENKSYLHHNKASNIYTLESEHSLNDGFGLKLRRGYQLAYICYMGPNFLSYILPSLRWWKHMLGHSAKSVESYLWCGCYSYLHSGIHLPTTLCLCFGLLSMTCQSSWHMIMYSPDYGWMLNFLLISCNFSCIPRWLS